MSEAVQLPGGIRVDGSIAFEVELRELSGVEEDLLVALKRRQQGDKSGKAAITPSVVLQRLSAILARCTVRMGPVSAEENREPETATQKPFFDAWHGALSGDRAVALIALRRLSLGDAYVFTARCPMRDCRTEIPRVRADLGALEITRYFDAELRAIEDAHAGADPATIATLIEDRRMALLGADTHEVVLPSGKTVEWRLMGTEAEESAAMLNVNSPEDIASALIKLRTVKIDGEDATIKKLKYLLTKDRNFLKNYFDQWEGGPDTRLEITCPNDSCGHVFMRPLEVGSPSFFFQSETA